MTKVKEHYTWESHVDTYMKVLEPIIDQNRRLPRVPLQRRPIMYQNGAIVSSIDQNLLGDRQSLQELIGILNEHRNNISFCIATGRRLDSALRVVANRHQEELSKIAEIEPIYFSQKQFVAGIIDGLQHFDTPRRKTDADS